jgi:rare lipoprotein A
MRPQTKLRRACVRALTGALAAAPFMIAAPAAEAAGSTVALRFSDTTPAYGQRVSVSGRAARQDAGRTVVLEYADGSAAWRPLRTGRVGANGRYAFSVALTRSGILRTVVTAAARPGEAVASQATVSASARIAVAPVVRASATRLAVMPGGVASVTGYIRPGGAGRTVRLQRHAGAGWRTVATSRTTANGRFVLHFRAGRTGSHAVRVAVAGNGGSAPTTRGVGRLSVYRSSTASLYTMYGGALACGGHLGYRSMVVAHRSLPCGTLVTVRYRGRSAQARVMDRGPFVGGREFDLAGAVARKLGFDGVRRIWVAVGR